MLARLLELADHRSSWNRALWQLGSVASIRECLEYNELVRDEVSSLEGLQYVAQFTAEQVKQDPGCGADAIKDLVETHLAVNAKSAPKGLAEASIQKLEVLATRINNRYLLEWVDIIEGGKLSLASATGVSVELAARSVASHVFDGGLSGDHVHGWLLSLQKRSEEAGGDFRGALSEFMKDAHAALLVPPREWRVLVPFARLPGDLIRSLQEVHLSAERLDEYCDLAGLKRERRGAGALWLKVCARDEYAAIAQADALVRKLIARVKVGGDVASASGRAALESEGKWRTLRTWQPVAKLPSIVRHDLIFSQVQAFPTEAARLDDALELLSVLDESTSWASVSSAWAAVESLLAPGQRRSAVTAADRLAAIVTCSYPRAELTNLAWVWKGKGHDRVAAQLASAATSNRRLTIIHRHLLSHDVPPAVAKADPVGAARALELVRNPKPVLDRVQRYLQSSLRRLYNQRNRVMHSASSDSVALPATLRTTPGLVAAGVDRIVHAVHARPSISPLALAARAEIELSLLGGPGERASHRLL
ncbi:hypothetical protein GCM10022247_42800 [Allokutzneria multivorans]|uniref:Apea-like HEPN domain-containing protein n=1 Tax=Allokutzneria multivorans TaxID=1142134 RepID=A0ABP7SRV5_9PSEU